MTSSSGSETNRPLLGTPVSRRALTQLCRYGLIQECFAVYEDGRGQHRQGRIEGWSGEADDPLLALVDRETGQNFRRYANEVRIYRYEE